MYKWNIIWLRKRMKSYLCNNMDEPRGYQLNEISQTERQMPHDFTYMWNIKNQINKQQRNRLIDAENKLMVARGEESWRGWVKGLWSTNW